MQVFMNRNAHRTTCFWGWAHKDATRAMILCCMMQSAASAVAAAMVADTVPNFASEAHQDHVKRVRVDCSLI